MNYLLESESGEKFILKVDDNGQLFTERYTEIVNVEDIYLNEYNITLVVDGFFELIPSIVPNNATDKNLIWKSSDEKIAKIEKGIIYAISEGDAIISISSNDKRIKKECKVKVIKDLVKYGLLCHIDVRDFKENKINDRNNNINFEIVGEPILKDKYLYFDGVNDMLYTPRIKELLTNYTISVVFNESDLAKYSIQNKKTAKIIWNGNDFRGYAAICIYASRVNDNKYQVMTGRYTILPPKVYYNGDLSSHISFVNIDLCIDVVKGIYIVYKNGVKIGGNMLEESVVNTNFIVIGGIYTDKPYSYSYSNIGSLKVYTRILSEDEIVSNYEYERNIRG